MKIFPKMPPPLLTSRVLIGVLCAGMIAATVAACTGRPEGVQPVEDFDVTRYQGKWFEIMRLDHRFERGLTNVTATYTLSEDGTLLVENRGFDPEKCAWDVATGSAEFQGDPKIASLSVTFFWPFAGGYHVIALDRDDYGWAMVAGPSREYLWILARNPDLSPAIREELVDEARRLGFPTGDLIRVDHSAPACEGGGQPN